MRLAVVQTSPQFGAIDVNIQEALSLMESAAADLYVLPELFNTGYNFLVQEELAGLAENADGKTCGALTSFARKAKVHIAYGFAERADRIFNSAAITGPNGLVGVYRKVHLFDRENLFFAPGNLGFPVYDLPLGRVGMMICFDWIYPESARSLAVQGAQFIAHPANLVLPHCPDAMVTRCLENRVFTATADRVGVENRGGISLNFIGSSELVAPDGKILTKLPSEKSAIAAVDIDLTFADNKKINKFNHLMRGRRRDQYDASL